MTVTTTQLKETLASLEELDSRYELTSDEFSDLLSTLKDLLKLELVEIGEASYLTPLQVALLDSLKPLFKDRDQLKKFVDNLKNGALLYRCLACGELKLTKELLEGDRLLHTCSAQKLKTRFSTTYDFSSNQTETPTGRFEILASGPLENLIQWTHSVNLNLDDPSKATI